MKWLRFAYKALLHIPNDFIDKTRAKQGRVGG